MMNDDDGLPNLMCEVQAKSWKFREGSLLHLENHTWDCKLLKGMKNCLLKIWTCHYIILASILAKSKYELWRHITRKNQKIVRTPHILGRLNACENSVYQALLRFLRSLRTRLPKVVSLDHFHSSFTSIIIITPGPQLQDTSTSIILSYFGTQFNQQ